MANHRWQFRLLHGSWVALDWLFPPVCGGCGSAGTRWCPDCQKKVQLISGPVCDACGLPEVGSNLCDRCHQTLPSFKLLRSWAVFESPVQQALHRLKYRHDIGMGEALSNQLADFIRQLGWPIDSVIPIPLGKKRMRERGYNQVAMVAIPLSNQLGLDYLSTALIRDKETRSQVGLSASARQENVKNAFYADRKKINGRTIMLIDDVSTTGATLSSAAEALYSSGAKDVFAFTIARALPRHGLKTV